MSCTYVRILNGSVKLALVEVDLPHVSPFVGDTDLPYRLVGVDPIRPPYRVGG